MKFIQRNLSVLFTLLLVLSTVLTPISTFAETQDVVDKEILEEPEEELVEEDATEPNSSEDSTEVDTEEAENEAVVESSPEAELEDETTKEETEKIETDKDASPKQERAPPVTVNVRVETHEKTLAPTTEVTVDNFDLSPYGGPETTDSPRAIHAIIQALQTVDGLDLTDQNDFQLGFGGNYIASVGGLAEFSNGPFSGWKYFIDNQFVAHGVLDRTIQNGESIVLYYVDDFNETFSWFDKEYYSIEAGDPLEVELTGVTFNEVNPVEGAAILIDELAYSVDGKTAVTDENGKIELIIEEPATYHLSAKRENTVRPYAIVEVTEKVVPDTVPPVITVEGLNDGDIVTEEQINFTVEAIDDVDGDIIPFVQVNEQSIESKDGTYKAILIEGENTIAISATDEAGNNAIKKYTIVYEPEKEENIADYNLEERIQKAAEYTLSVGVNSEWQALGLAKAGYKVPTSYHEIFYQNIADQITKGLENGRFKITDAERLVLAALALEKDPENIGGENLIDLIYNSPMRGNFDTMTFQGNNGPIFALIALDSKKYPEPSGAKWTREKLITELLTNQNEDGSWHLSNLFDSPSLDITTMAVTGLSPYKDQPEVKTAIENALDYLSNVQNDEGGFTEPFVGGTSSETTSQAIIALTAYGVDPTSDRFTKNGNNLIDHLLSNQHEDGGFKHTQQDSSSNAMATEQALQALLAYQLYFNDEGALYDFGKIETEPEDELPVDDQEPEQPSKKEVILEKISVTKEVSVEIPETKTKIKLPTNLPEETTLTVAKPDETEVINSTKGMNLAGDIFDFEFDFGESEEDFTGSFELTLGVSEEIDINEVDVYHFDEEIEEWELIEHVLYRDEENRTITVEVSHFSMYGVFAQDEPSENKENPIEETPGNKEDPIDETPGNEEEPTEGERGTEGDDSTEETSGTEGDESTKETSGTEGDESTEETSRAEDDETTKEGSVENNKENLSTEINGTDDDSNENSLPNTATNTYNFLLFGIVMLVLGMSFFFFQKRKAIKND